MKQRISKVLLAADLLVCSVWTLFVWHWGMSALNPFWAVVLFLLYPVFLRLNISFMFYRNDKRVVWTLLTFTVLSLPGLCTGLLFRTIDRMVYYVLYAVDPLCHTGHLGNYDWMVFHSSSPYWLLTGVGLMVALTVWVWLLPVVGVIWKGWTRQLCKSGSPWYTVWMGNYHDSLVVRYISLFGLVWIAFLIGLPMPYYPSLLATWVLPCVAFGLIGKYSGYRLRMADWVIVPLASVLIWYSQYTMNLHRLVLLTVSALLMLYAAIRLWKGVRNVGVCVFAFLLCGFALPLLSIGYNVYSVRYAKRDYVYVYPRSRQGVLRVTSEGGTGLRDRYGIIIRPLWKQMEQENEQSGLFKPHLVLKRAGERVRYDYLTGDYERIPSTCDEGLERKVRTVLGEALTDLDVEEGSVLVMEAETGKIRSMVDIRFPAGCEEEKWIRPHETVLMRPLSLLAILESGKASVEDVLAADSSDGLAALVGKAFEDAPVSFWYALRRLGYGQPYSIPRVSGNSIQNPALTLDAWTDSTSVKVALGHDKCLAPFQMLALYNALANGGCLLVPKLENGKETVINERIASPQHIETIRRLLAGKADKMFQGETGFSVAGMSGTEEHSDYWDFCGFTLSGKTKYTVYVSVRKPENAEEDSRLRTLVADLIRMVEGGE